MDQTLFIGISIFIVVMVFILVHSWVHKRLRFKMDESAILKCLQEAREEIVTRSTTSISLDTQIDVERVNTVCSQSKLIERLADSADSWCLK